MNTFKLYELSDAMNRVAEMIEEGADGLEDTLESIEGTFQDKVESIAKLIRSKAASRDLIDEEKNRLSKRAAALDKQVQWLTDYVEREMLRTNKTEVKGALFTAKLAMTPPRVEVSDAQAIPHMYLRLVPASSSPDKAAIKEAIQSGKNVPGCELKQDLKLKIK